MVKSQKIKLDIRNLYFYILEMTYSFVKNVKGQNALKK